MALQTLCSHPGSPNIILHHFLIVMKLDRPPRCILTQSETSASTCLRGGFTEEIRPSTVQMANTDFQRSSSQSCSLLVLSSRRARMKAPYDYQRSRRTLPPSCQALLGNTSVLCEEFSPGLFHSIDGICAWSVQMIDECDGSCFTLLGEEPQIVLE